MAVQISFAAHTYTVPEFLHESPCTKLIFVDLVDKERPARVVDFHGPKFGVVHPESKLHLQAKEYQGCFEVQYPVSPGQWRSSAVIWNWNNYLKRLRH